MPGGKRTEADISAIMRKVRSTQNTPEAMLRNSLEQAGLTIDCNRPDIQGKPDIALFDPRIAIFVDGDYWHGNQWRRRGKTSLEEQFSKSKNKDYWLKKIRRNMRRDMVVTKALVEDGWIVIRMWESDIRSKLEACNNMVVKSYTDEVTSAAASRLPDMSVAEFFAGIGLMRMGLEQSDWQIVFANDIDDKKRDMYLAHFSNAEDHFALGDIHELAADDVPSVTLATASFPCNDLSLAGARAGLSGNESSAFWGFVRVLRDMADRRPPLVLLENVPGLLTSHKGGDFRQTLVALNELGYAVDTFFVDAVRFVPQSRQRLFIMGVNRALASHDYDETQMIESDARPRSLITFIRANQDINWSIRPLPSFPSRSHTLDWVLEDLPEAANEWWSSERATYLLNQMSPTHRERVERMISMPEWSYSTVFRRMRKGKSMAEVRSDGIAGCLRTPRGGSGRQILIKAGYGEFHARLLTPRECARLMGADDFRINVPLNQALFGFGDAVCVPAINWIATYYLNPLINEAIHGQPLVADHERIG